jgi:hypothetical protein
MGDQAIDKQADMLETTESLLAQLDAISLARSTAAAYRNGQCRDEALWRTLMGDHGDETRPAPAPYKKAYEAWRRICIGLCGPLLDNKISDQIIVGLNVTLKGPFPLVGESEVSRESDVSRFSLF